MDEHDPELKRRLESLADRTEGRGAASVLAAARARAAASGPNLARRNGLLLASVAACVALIAATATLVSQNASSSHRSSKIAAGVTTTTTNTTGGTDQTTPEPNGSTESTTQTSESTATTGATTKPGVTSTTKATTRTTATTKTTTGPNDPARVRLQSFSSCPALVDYVRTEGVKDVGPYGLPGSMNVTVATGNVVATPTAKSPDSASPTSTTVAASSQTTGTFSGTNNQEADVDEPDQVKTDGKRIFTIAQGKLWAAAADNQKVVGSLGFDSVYPYQLLLSGDRLLVIGSSAASGSSGGVAQPMVGRPAYFGQARVLVVDVKDPSAMKVLNTLTIDGGYISARMVNGIARLVIRSEPKGFDWQYPKDGTAEAQQQATDHNRQLVAQSTTNNWMPNFTVADGAGKTSPSRPLTDCNDALRPATFSGFGMLSVFTVDPAHPDATNATSVLAGGDVVYASTTGLYVSTTAWDHLESQGQVIRYAADTMIHKFDISSPSGASYRVSGRVPGTALSQYSFSELDGNLRVATTASDPSSTQSYVTILDDDGKALTVIGQVDGLGKGERIYAVRFIGTAGYVVTFRQTDPLYTLDLSDPTKPKVVGELKLLGYSAYLHPIGDGLLMGVGQDATDQGRRLGSQVSVFDVSDPANPKLLQKLSLGQGQSTAEFDPHAFLWWPATNQAVLPVYLYGSNGSQTFVGAVGVKATASSLTEVGRVSHPAQQQGNGSYTPPIERSLVIGSSLFTMSQRGLLASDLATMSQNNWIPFS